MSGGSGDWALFLDRDGVINRRIIGDYVRTWDDFSFLSGVLTAMPQLAAWAPHIVVVTNQQGVGKGLMSASALTNIHDRMRLTVALVGGRIDDVRSCPHVAGSCVCRKPAPGLVQRWLAEHPDIDASACVMVGDSAGDMAMARAAGIGTKVWIDARADSLTEQYDERYSTLAAFAQHVGSTHRSTAA